MATTVMSSGGTDEAVPVLRQPASQPASRPSSHTRVHPYWAMGKGREGKERKREGAVRFMAAAAAAVLLNRAVYALLA